MSGSAYSEMLRYHDPIAVPAIKAMSSYPIQTPQVAIDFCDCESDAAPRAGYQKKDGPAFRQPKHLPGASTYAAYLESLEEQISPPPDVQTLVDELTTPPLPTMIIPGDLDVHESGKVPEVMWRMPTKEPGPVYPEVSFSQSKELSLSKDPGPIQIGFPPKSLTKQQLAQLVVTHDGLYKCIVYMGLRGDHIEDPDLADKIKILEHCYLESQYLVQEIGKELVPLYQNTHKVDRAWGYQDAVLTTTPEGVQWTKQDFDNARVGVSVAGASGPAIGSSVFWNRP